MTKQEEREKRLEDFAMINEMYIRGFPIGKLRAFIQSEIDLALANRDKEIVEKIEGIKIPKEKYKKVVNGKTSTNPEYMGCNLALQDIIHLITKDNE